MVLIIDRWVNRDYRSSRSQLHDLGLIIDLDGIEQRLIDVTYVTQKKVSDFPLLKYCRAEKLSHEESFGKSHTENL